MFVNVNVRIKILSEHMYNGSDHNGLVNRTPKAPAVTIDAISGKYLSEPIRLQHVYWQTNSIADEVKYRMNF